MTSSRDYTAILNLAEKNAALVADPELRKLAFAKVLDELHAPQPTNWFGLVPSLIQVLSVVIGVLISVLSFNAARHSESEAKRMEAARPFLELRQKLYLEAVHAAGILANREGHSEAVVNEAKARFRELYVAELSLVESRAVESQMMALAQKVDPDLGQLKEDQRAAYDLAHALRDSLVKSWGIDEAIIDNPHH